MRGLFVVCCAVFYTSVARADETTRADFEYLWDTVATRYAYVDATVETRWQCVRETLLLEADKASSQDALPLFERALEALTDFHAHMNINNARSQRLVPSATDLHAALRDGRAVVASVRARGAAARLGVRADDELIAVNDVPIAQAIQSRLPICVDPRDATAQHWALQALIAGRRDAPRKLTIKHVDGRVRALWLPAVEAAPISPRRAFRREDGIAVIPVTDLGHDDTVGRVDAAIARYRDARAIVLDLRETAGGGNTRVAEPILGRFITQTAPYQLVESREGVRSARTVAPRGPFTLSAPIAVIVGPWTASMGEGVAIGLNALRGAPVIGQAMAGLRGSVETFTLPRSGWRFSIPTERLLHVNGTPREAFVPMQPGKTAYGGDAIYVEAIRALNLPSRQPK